MRKQLVQTVESILKQDPRVALLLGDIGVFGFRNAFQLFPNRVYNVGILEQSTASMAAGLAMTGFIPVIHTIAPFLVERCFEQLKVDFGYQKLGGNFISVGASYDYASLGCTHHCPGDIAVLKSIPGMEIVVPGTSAEFDSLFRQSYANGKPTYFRLSEREHSSVLDVKPGKAQVLKIGGSATVIAVGPLLDAVSEAVAELDVTLLYYTTLLPFDSETLRQNCHSEKVILCEPYYEGGLAFEIFRALGTRAVSLKCIGVPVMFLTDYGKPEDHDTLLGLTPEKIRVQIDEFVKK